MGRLERVAKKVLWLQAFRKDRYRFEFDMTSQPFIRCHLKTKLVRVNNDAKTRHRIAAQ